VTDEGARAGIAGMERPTKQFGTAK